MCGIEKLFDLDGDGKMNTVEMAFAYTVMFGSEEETQESSLTDDDLSVSDDLSDCGSGEWDEY